MCGGLDITLVGQPPAILAIHVRIAGGPSGEAVDVPVVHAEGGGDQNRIVDLLVGCAFPPGPRDVIPVTYLPPF
jgi:hypothetical protein